LARVTLADEAGSVLRFTATNPFGYFRIEGISAGTYTITARRKGVGSSSMVISVSSSITDLNFVL
jgi:hypothetical protein